MPFSPGQIRVLRLTASSAIERVENAVAQRYRETLRIQAAALDSLENCIGEITPLPHQNRGDSDPEKERHHPEEHIRQRRQQSAEKRRRGGERHADWHG